MKEIVCFICIDCWNKKKEEKTESTIKPICKQCGSAMVPYDVIEIYMAKEDIKRGEYTTIQYENGSQVCVKFKQCT